MTLKEETLKILQEHGKTIDDVIWAGCPEFTVPLDEFWMLTDVTYDNGYGAQEVAYDLLVVGKDFWMDRREYDGAEWWEYHAMPTKPEKEMHVKTLIGHNGAFWWSSLTEIGLSDENKNRNEEYIKSL